MYLRIFKGGDFEFNIIKRKPLEYHGEICINIFYIMQNFLYNFLSSKFLIVKIISKQPDVYLGKFDPFEIKIQ